MQKNDVIEVFYRDTLVGRVGFDLELKQSTFQYSPNFIDDSVYQNLFPVTEVVKKTKIPQIFKNYDNETFRCLPPFIADSLPDLFGNIIFKEWLEASKSDLGQISVLEQLAYVADRGMGALEYRPRKEIPKESTIDLSEIIEILRQVLSNKRQTQSQGLNTEALLTVFKIGSSAGGARPKVLVSEHKKTRELIPGDLEVSSDYNHLLVKLFIDESIGYKREVIEYCYYKTATHIGIQMMASKLIDGIHFATERFDRQNGIKSHVLTASGLTGIDFKEARRSSYELLFDLMVYLKMPYSDLEELFRRMVFNIVFANFDDHLKNHSFLFNDETDSWRLTPAYDLTYSLNPLMNVTRSARALTVNGTRSKVDLNDVLQVAKRFGIKHPMDIIKQVESGIPYWHDLANAHNINPKVRDRISGDFQILS